MTGGVRKFKSILARVSNKSSKSLKQGSDIATSLVEKDTAYVLSIQRLVYEPSDVNSETAKNLGKKNLDFLPDVKIEYFQNDVELNSKLYPLFPRPSGEQLIEGLMNSIDSYLKVSKKKSVWQRIKSYFSR